MTRWFVLAAVLLAGRAWADPPPKPEEAPPGDALGIEAHAPPEPVQPPDEWSYQPVDDGALGKTGPGKFPGYRAQRDAFDLDIAPDGEAKVHDKRNLRFQLGNPPATRTNERPRADGLPLPRPPEPEVRDQEGERPIEHDVGSIGVAIARFDVTDWMMRNHGQDPYASRKLAALDQTRDRRAMIGEMYRARRLELAAQIMEGNLERMWTDVWDPARRKRELFALWDECAETGPDGIVKAGGLARAQVLAFVARALPAGAPGAFTPDELAELNAHRASQAVFAPY